MADLVATGPPPPAGTDRRGPDGGGRLRGLHHARADGARRAAGGRVGVVPHPGTELEVRRARRLQADLRAAPSARGRRLRWAATCCSASGRTRRAGCPRRLSRDWPSSATGWTGTARRSTARDRSRRTGEGEVFFTRRGGPRTRSSTRRRATAASSSRRVVPAPGSEVDVPGHRRTGPRRPSAGRRHPAAADRGLRPPGDRAARRPGVRPRGGGAARLGACERFGPGPMLVVALPRRARAGRRLLPHRHGRLGAPRPRPPRSSRNRSRAGTGTASTRRASSAVGCRGEVRALGGGGHRPGPPSRASRAGHDGGHPVRGRRPEPAAAPPRPWIGHRREMVRLILATVAARRRSSCPATTERRARRPVDPGGIRGTESA